MTDIEKCAHDIAVAIMQKNVKPLADGDDFNEYMSSIISLYFDVFSFAKIKFKDHQN